jgi:membrane protein required for colicin V production
METYDIAMLVVLVAATIFGAIKGFAWQMASIASIGISYFVAYRFREPFSESIKADPPWNKFLAMLILYVGTSLLIWIVFRIVSKSIDRLKLKEFDRHVGAAFGLGKGILYCVLITLFAITLSNDAWKQKIVQSRSGFYIAKLLDGSQAIMPPELSKVIRPYLDRLEQQLQGAGGGGNRDDFGGGLNGQFGGDLSSQFGDRIRSQFGDDTSDNFGDSTNIFSDTANGAANTDRSPRVSNGRPSTSRRVRGQ